MAKQRVIAYFMHESEANAARPMLQNAEETESFFVGEIEESDLPAMKAAGLIVQDLSLSGEPLTEAREVKVQPSGLLGGIDFSGPRAAAPQDPSSPRFYQLVLSGPMLEPWRMELAEHGVRITDRLRQPFTVVARIPPMQVGAVSALPFVTAVTMMDGEDSRPRESDVASFRASEGTGVRAMIPYDVILHEAESAGAVRQWLRDRHVEIGASGGTKFRIYLPEDSATLFELSDVSEVAFVEPYVAPRLHNDEARILLGIDRANPGTSLKQEGEGQIVGVADTGIDDQHPDIPSSRVAGIVALGRSGNHSDTHGHGTHVSGSILGDGTASGGKLRGAAPKAKLFFQSLLDAQGGLGGLPFRLQGLFEEAYQNGARIHNNSWGAATASSYRVSSNEVDDFVQTRKDMLVVISAGNEGTAANPVAPARRNSAAGFVDWLSIGSPATSKNALTVGASQNKRTSGGFSQMTYGAAWGNDYPDPPLANEQISGNPDSMAAFSSRGPCDDFRIKPDVVAPGTDILSCKSKLAPLRNFWGPHTSPQYAYMGGTSMSAPLVSGCAALVREYYTDDRGASPSAALLKATIINGTRRLTAPSAVADHNMTPNYHQGFGCVDMSRTIPNPAAPKMKLEFYDNWEQKNTHFKTTGQRRRFQVTVAAGEPFRLCMAYNDPPGRALQNNLNLLVEDPTGRKWMGNEQLPNGLNIPDPTNNVEILRFDQPPAGVYLIQVMAANLLRPPQDFALVVTGNISNFVQV